MYTVFVQLQVHQEKLFPFLEGIHKNANASLANEPGCIRFDVQRDLGDPTWFYFYEIYLSQEAFEIEHKNAPHFADWKKIVAECVVPGTQQNTYATPAFPLDIPERPNPDLTESAS